MSPSPFSSLHKDMASEILARVPKRLYPILACFSKNLRSLVRSPDIHKIRSLLRKDSLYICFMHKSGGVHTPHWFTLRRTENKPPSEKNHFVSVVVNLAFPDPNEHMPSIIACGPEIFFISGSLVPSSTVWIFDSRTGVSRQGPSMNEERLFKSVGLVGSKIYVVEGYVDDEIHQAESFDVKNESWEHAPRPELESSFLATANVSLDRKVCALMSVAEITVCYDTRDGSCEVFGLPKDKWWRTGVCVIDNVLYVYYARFGLMWYDTELKLWRVVTGLDDLKKVRSVAMAEYYGKMAFLWRDFAVVGGVMKEVWCRMIALDRSEEGINGTAESGQLMGSVPRGYRLQHCLSVSE
ncbi:F-box/kelch-repeat protein [Raphanus sativus]|uniref:F-box/kelch-repeat protein At2g44700 n=1 Tax=Raphanus sativus TaxID=3726 RepID=A0A6J0L5Y4_RAPSA|nr:F-box/kelch-repeat protein At2g44700 [Raphanus sativus]KAJ4876706.1 F-box/kelch-repeat protein [Raphanus sativus]